MIMPMVLGTTEGQPLALISIGVFQCRHWAALPEPFYKRGLFFLRWLFKGKSLHFCTHCSGGRVLAHLWH